MSIASAPHWLVVVRRDRPDLGVQLRQSFTATPFVEVVLDRRSFERRREHACVPHERRRGDRRKARAPGEPSPTSGYRLVERADGFEVLESVARVPARCPECRVFVEFEMPRFAELPARLDVEVVHWASTLNVRHVVETEAFRASGRPLLACRMLGRHVSRAAPPPR